MAVRHGYGKIAGMDALVFAYDTGDTRNSYKGEPTENIRASSGLDGSYSDSGRTIDNSGTLTAPDGTTGWSSISSPGSNSNYRIAKFTYNSLSANTTYTFSLELYNPGPNALEIFLDGNAGYAGTTIPLGYSKWTYTITRESSSTQAIFFGAENKTANATYSPERLIYFKNYQVEQKSHATPFVDGTRSATEGLKDLTGNSSIDLTNAGFNSNAKIDLDGTDESFEIGNYVASQGNVGSIEVVFKADDNHRGAMVGWGDLGTSNWGTFEIGASTSGYSDEFISYVNASAGSGYTLTMLGRDSTDGSYKLNDGKYHHAVAIVDGVENTIYVDGEKVSTLSYQHGSATVEEFLKQTSTTNVRIGNSTYNGGHIPFDGQIPLVKIYSRGLTAAEVQSNYRHYKKRFNI